MEILIYIVFYNLNLDIGALTSNLGKHIQNNKRILTVRQPLAREATKQVGQSHDLICLSLITNTTNCINEVLRRLQFEGTPTQHPTSRSVISRLSQNLHA